MIPKCQAERLSNNMRSNMHSANTNGQSFPQPHVGAAFGKYPKGWQLKLSLETRNRGDVMIVHCQGRIVYRDEAVALSRLVGEIIDNGGKVVLDLGGVSAIDSAGIGELVFLHTWAQSRKANFKCASPNPFVRDLLQLTNLNSVLDIHASVGEALSALRVGEVCADC